MEGGKSGGKRPVVVDGGEEGGGEEGVLEEKAGMQ